MCSASAAGATITNPTPMLNTCHISASSTWPRRWIISNKGGTVIAGGTKLEMTNVELEKMNYLVEGVVGTIPA